MSYDLMVFDPKAPPADRKGFMAWYAEQVRWGEGHRYDNPEVATPELRAWFHEMITHFPAMNGPHASADVDHPKVTDYSVGKFVIYAGFAWSQAEDAFRTMFSLAEKHRVGFFDVSAGNGGVWMPDPAGHYACVHGQGSGWSGRTMGMARFLTFVLWSLVGLGVAAIALIVGYALRNSSGHTAWEPFTALVLFVPLAVVGAACIALRHRVAGIARASVCALAVGVAGVALIVTLDRTNRLVQYDRWIHRGLP